MGRASRADEAGGVYHAFNRGNAKQSIFFKEATKLSNEWG